jgi:uncharacterized protein YkwD
MKFPKTLILVTAVMLAACATKKPAGTTVANGQVPPTAVQPADQGPQLSNDEIARRLFDAVNKTRIDAKLPALQSSPELASSAQAHSDKMAAGTFLSTRGPDEPSVVTRLTTNGVKTLKLGENVVRVKINSNQLADETLGVWMNTPPDRKNILSAAFTKGGVGVTHAADGDYYLTEDFAQ